MRNFFNIATAFAMKCENVGIQTFIQLNKEIKVCLPIRNQLKEFMKLNKNQMKDRHVQDAYFQCYSGLRMFQ